MDNENLEVPEDAELEETPVEEPATFWLSGTLYDRLKFLAQVGLPAFATFYLTLGQTWGFPATEQVVATVVALNTLLGAVLMYTKRQYNNSDAAFDGDINLEPDHENDITNVGVSIAPASLESGQKEVRLKVHHR